MKQPASVTNASQLNKTLADIPIWGWLLLALAIVAGIWLITRQNTSTTAGLPKAVSVDEALKLREEGAFMLDVREVSEWNEFHMPEATLIPLGELPNRLNEVPQDQKIVVVCRSGNRSQTGRDTLLRAGFTNVTSMDGGMNEWRGKGYPVVTGP